MSWRKVEFSGRDSIERIRKLQALCSDNCNTPLDGILIIGGVDSSYSDISQAVLKYLFLGSSGQELLGKQVIAEQYDRLEDVVLFISRQQVLSIFYSSESEAAAKILPVISQWRHVIEYVVHDGMELDDQEARKIDAFKQMVAGKERIGIPFGIDSDGMDLSDTMITEKWPLIQSYGLENGGTSKGFFTMNHHVVNVSTILRDAMSELDGFHMKRIAYEVEPLLMHHFSQFLTKLDHAESPEVRDKKSENDMGEDLFTFYEFGTMQYEARELKVAPIRGCHVLFGKRTSTRTLKSSSSAYLSNSGGVDGFPATHMLVQVEDPFTGVQFTRTYFLSTGRTANRIIDHDALVQPELDEKLEKYNDDYDNSVDTQLLIELYILLLHGLKVAMKSVANECERQGNRSLALCVPAAKDVAIHTIKKYSMSNLTGQVMSRLPSNFIEEHLLINMKSLDARGIPIDVPRQKWNLLYMSLEFEHIPSQINATDSLGSVIVGDTFVFKDNAVGPGNEPRFLNVTKTFPYFRSWIQSGKEAAHAKELMKVLQSDFMPQSNDIQLGKVIPASDESVLPEDNTQEAEPLVLDKAMMLLDCEDFPVLHGNLHLFTAGFVFESPHLNPIWVSFAKHVVSFCINSTHYEELVLLQFVLKEDATSMATPVSNAVPFHFRSRYIFFPLLTGARFQQEMMQVLTTWKMAASSLNIPFYRPHELNDELGGITPRDSELASINSLPIVLQSCKQLMHQQENTPVQIETIEQLFPNHIIPKDANPNTTLPKPQGDPSKLCIPVTVLLGIPGSEVFHIARLLYDISASAFGWIQLQIDTREMKIETTTDSFEANVFRQIQSQLGQALQQIKERRNLQLHPRILLSIIGYVDPITVAAAIKYCSRSTVITMKLAALIACASATNFYIPDPLETEAPFPKLFDQLTAGFTTHIVLTHANDVSSAQLGRLRFHVDQVNPFADIHVLSQEVFEAPVTSLLVLDRFEATYYKMYRQTYFPHWNDKDDESAWSRYVADLEPKHRPETIHLQLSPGMERSKFLQLVTKTLTPHATLTKSMKKYFPFEHTEKPTKGIRSAQFLATKKVIHGDNLLNATVGERQEIFGTCWCVEGRVVFSNDPSTVYEYVSTGTAARLRRAISRHDDREISDNQLEIKITGHELYSEKLRSLILQCYARTERTILPIRTKATITMDEKRKIQTQHAMDPLPEGYMFDGVHYVDFFGGRYEFHPNIAQFIEEYLKEANVKVEESRMTQQTYVKVL